MSDTSDVQALESISTEVGDSQIKITLSSQCIKAQAFLVDKLRKQSERRKEFCSFISSNNLKLQTEIRQAEIEIKSLMLAMETIKSSNVELKKESLLLKERKFEIEERVKDGEKKYEDLWLQAKARYESIPFVQKLLQAQNKTETYKENLLILKEKSESVTKEIDIKQKIICDLDSKRIIELAQYIVHDLPRGIKTIQEKTKAIRQISNNIDEIIKQQDDKINKGAVVPTPTLVIEEKLENEMEKSKNVVEDGWFNFGRENSPDSIMMPQVQLIQSDFDALSAKLDKIKINTINIFNITPAKRIDPIEPETGMKNKKSKKDDDFSIYFGKTNNEEFGADLDTKKESFSKRKLINILEDIQLDKNDAYEMVLKVNPNNLKGVQKIGTDTRDEGQGFNANDEKEQAHEDIEEIDLTKRSDDILVPPTQFLDFGEANYFSSSQQQVEVIVHMSMTDSTGKASQNLRNSQENKKRVCFDLPMSIQEINEENEDIGNPLTKTSENEIPTKEIEAVNDTNESQVDISFVSDETYTKMKDMILKKHNLDLSPQFVYAKNKTLQIANGADDKIITSKFFESSEKDIEAGKDLPDVTESLKGEIKSITQTPCDDANMELDEVVVSSPKVANILRPERTVTGLLFNHGAQGIPDSLNVSISTTGFDEGDADFPHGIDSSLLMSPKADFPLPNTADNAEVYSQEVPNFLSGLRKTGFSFFGQSATSDSKASTSEQNQSNFNFNFGGDEKKGRGGLFNMFR